MWNGDNMPEVEMMTLYIIWSWFKDEEGQNNDLMF